MQILNTKLWHDLFFWVREKKVWLSLFLEIEHVFFLVRAEHTGQRDANVKLFTSCFSLLLSTEAVAFFSPRPHLYLPCFAPLSRWETLSALLSKLKDYGFDQLVS